MSNGGNNKSFQVDFEKLPAQFPTHRHFAAFWEALGRVVATFGFLEHTLGRAIFALTATRLYPEEEIQTAYEKMAANFGARAIRPFGGTCQQL